MALRPLHPAFEGTIRRYSTLIVILTILILVPIACMFVGAFRSGSFLDPRGRFTFDKIRLVYATEYYLRTLAFSLGISGIVAILATVVGAILAWLIARTDLPWKGFAEISVIAPLFLSPFVGALAWLILGSPRSGLINATLVSWLHLTGPVMNITTPHRGHPYHGAVFHSVRLHDPLRLASEHGPFPRRSLVPERRRRDQYDASHHPAGNSARHRLLGFLHLRPCRGIVLDSRCPRRLNPAALPCHLHLLRHRKLPD